MFSEKSLKILYDLKYQLASLKEKDHLKSFIEGNKEEVENGKATKDVIKEFNAYQAILAMYDPATFDFNTPGQKKKCAQTIVTVGQFLQPNIQKSLNQKFSSSFNMNPQNPEHIFDFNNKSVPDEVINFLKDEMSEQDKKFYERLAGENSTSLLGKTSNFIKLQYDKMKWHYWYWPNLYYGERSWKVWPYILSQVVLGFSVSLLGMTVMPFEMMLAVFVLMVGTAGIAPESYIEKFLLCFLVAAICVGLFFCPPISVGLIFGATLAYWPAMFANMGMLAAISAGLWGVDYGVRKLIEPEIDIDVECLLQARTEENRCPPGNSNNLPAGDFLEEYETYCELLKNLPKNNSLSESKDAVNEKAPIVAANKIDDSPSKIPATENSPKNRIQKS